MACLAGGRVDTRYPTTPGEPVFPIIVAYSIYREPPYLSRYQMAATTWGLATLLIEDRGNPGLEDRSSERVRFTP